jgi:hypothetical protein
MGDAVIEQIADYIVDLPTFSQEAWSTAGYCLLDAVGCGLLALQYPACTKLLGPTVPGAVLAGGARVPGTGWQLDPVQAAFNIGCQIRWLDYNDTWLAAEWGHPSDNFGAILALADYLDRNPSNHWRPNSPIRLEEVLRKHHVKTVDYLNIDCEGNDLKVLQSNDWNIWRPQVVTVEDHSLCWHDSEIVDFMASKRYILKGRMVFTSVFALEEK